MLITSDLIMSGTSIRSFRHLEHQNPSIISEDIGGTEEEEDQRRSTVVLEDKISRISLSTTWLIIIISRITLCHTRIHG